MIKTDYLVIGSGIAGLSFALKACKTNDVALVTKKKLFDSSTGKAQGGVACVTDKDDTFESHIQDTLVAGDGLCNKEIVEIAVKSAPERIQELISMGMKFAKKDYNSSEFELGLEGGHSKRRILHAGDITGEEIEKVLVANIQKANNVSIYEDHMAIDLIIDGNKKCCGAYVYDVKNSKVEIFLAKVVVLACGGTGKVFLYTSNPDVATGDGIAMAYMLEERLGFQVSPHQVQNPGEGVQIRGVVRFLLYGFLGHVVRLLQILAFQAQVVGVVIEDRCVVRIDLKGVLIRLISAFGVSLGVAGITGHAAGQFQKGGVKPLHSIPLVRAGPDEGRRHGVAVALFPGTASDNQNVLSHVVFLDCKCFHGPGGSRHIFITIVTNIVNRTHGEGPLEILHGKGSRATACAAMETSSDWRRPSRA